MLCPFCHNTDTQVRDSRLSEEGQVVRRRRLCLNCDAKFTTFEKIQRKKLVVIKRSGVKKTFDRDKVLHSISAATRKRNITNEQIEELTDKIIVSLEQSKLKEIPTKKIGEIIMNQLAAIDQVAYVRFASVYKDFGSVNDFIKFIKAIKK